MARNRPHGWLKLAIIAELTADPTRDDFDIGLIVRCGPAYVHDVRRRHGFPKPARMPHELWYKLPECGSGERLSRKEYRAVQREILERAKLCRVYEETHR